MSANEAWKIGPALTRAIVRAVEDCGPGTYRPRFLYLDAPSMLRSVMLIGECARKHFDVLQNACRQRGVNLMWYDAKRGGFKVEKCEVTA